jgi:hypothetical protein
MVLTISQNKFFLFYLLVILQGTLGLTKIFQEKLYVFWLGWNPLVVLYKPEFVEVSHVNNKILSHK